jgi:hypothetical protein
MKRAVFGVAVLAIAWAGSLAVATNEPRSSARPATPAPVHAAPDTTHATALPSSLEAAACAQPAAAQAQSGGASRMSEQAFTNVQVLKGIPVDEFVGTMGFFSTALSVCCGDCHTGAGTSDPKWEDDPPRKRTARTMLRMVETINRTNFGGRQVVTCWTCHRGMLAPALTPPMDFAYGDAVPVPPDVLPRATSGVPTVDEVFDQYVQALGGAARVNALTSYVARGRAVLFGEIGDGDLAEIFAKAPDQIGMFVHQREGDVARTFDGRAAWFQLPLTVTPLYELTGSRRDGARLEAVMAFPWRAREALANWRVSYPSSLGGRDVNIVQASNATVIATLYFDKESGLLRRMIRYANTAVGRTPTQVDYSDYRPVAGVMMPFKFSYTWMAQREDWTLTEYEPNAAIDASTFGRPAN